MRCPCPTSLCPAARTSTSNYMVPIEVVCRRPSPRLLHECSSGRQPNRCIAPFSDASTTTSLLDASDLLSLNSPACYVLRDAEEDLEKEHRLLKENRQRLASLAADSARGSSSSPFEPQPEPSTSAWSGGPAHGCPVYVMLPLDTVWSVEREGKVVSVLKKERSLEIALHTLKQAGVAGVMIDVWWGMVERTNPRCYDFSAYQGLFQKVERAGLKVQAVMSFHAAGGNVGDTCRIPLPWWVLEVGNSNPDIFYTDARGHRNRECLSLGCDEEPLFWGRTPVDVYIEFVEEFVDRFHSMFGSVLTEITVGLGPAGELRYPAYPEGDGRWRFPGVGEFQCYDKYMLQDLKRAADAAGHPEWGLSGPHDAGHYNSSSWDTGFFASDSGSWCTPYGHFFLSWYSGLLVQHARRILSRASEVMAQAGRPRVFKAIKEASDGHVIYEFQAACKLGIKLAGVHWWFTTQAHAAELTAGYYNTRDNDGYLPIMALLSRLDARLSFTCVEMRDCEHPPEGRCSPQALLQHIIESAEAYGVPLAGENALQRYDDHAFDRIADSAFGCSARAGRLEQVTFLRMGDLMFDNWDAFSRFLKRMGTLNHGS